MMAMVCMHVYHGAWSMCQTLGLDAPDRNKLIRTGSAGLAIVLFVGFGAKEEEKEQEEQEEPI